MANHLYHAVEDIMYSKYNGDSALYNRHYEYAINRVAVDVCVPNTHEDIVEAIVRIMQAKLDAYSKTKPTTKGGRVARLFAPIVSAVLPFLKFIKLKK
jgi:hypothetical protein